MNKGLEQWHEIMRSGDTEALFELIHPDCVFWSPVVHTPQVGRDITFVRSQDVLFDLSFGEVGTESLMHLQILTRPTQRQHHTKVVKTLHAPNWDQTTNDFLSEIM